MRLLAGGVAFLTLLFTLPGGNPLPEVRVSLRRIRETADKDLRSRRLAGRDPEYDRRFFQMVLAARDSLPAGSGGVALYAPEIPSWGGLYLTIYEFAPIPVVLAPPRVPTGWIALTYGPGEAPSKLPLLRAFSHGTMLGPAP